VFVPDHHILVGEDQTLSVTRTVDVGAVEVHLYNPYASFEPNPVIFDSEDPDHDTNTVDVTMSVHCADWSTQLTAVLGGSHGHLYNVEHTTRVMGEGTYHIDELDSMSFVYKTVNFGRYWIENELDNYGSDVDTSEIENPECIPEYDGQIDFDRVDNFTLWQSDRQVKNYFYVALDGAPNSELNVNLQSATLSLSSSTIRFDSNDPLTQTFHVRTPFGGIHSAHVILDGADAHNYRIVDPFSSSYTPPSVDFIFFYQPHNGLANPASSLLPLLSSSLMIVGFALLSFILF